ncbi:MAG: efflux RND transporter periplasmic adaptor subunit [Methyloprofundus sp.]|nr:efflux RND transporter periplasmic adaptor subunit [Methyloprofundus sp.]
MIAFLLLCYLAILSVLVKFKVIQLTLWWKLSPLVWTVLLFILLFMPMQWGAPGGVTNNYQYLIEITPNVTGQVTEVPVKPLQPIKKGDVLFKIEPRPFQAAVDKLEANIKLSRINLQRARQLYARKVGPKVDVDKFTAELDKLTAELDAARYDLESTVVRAPGDGYVAGLSLYPGHRVGKFIVRSYISFIISDQHKVTIGINQNAMRHIRIGQAAEVTFKLLPGKVFDATVEAIVPITEAGHLLPDGNIPLAPSALDKPLPYSVILKLEGIMPNDTDFEALGINHGLPGGAYGTGAIYTDSVKATHIIRKVMLRMTAWMNYILP